MPQRSKSQLQSYIQKLLKQGRNFQRNKAYKKALTQYKQALMLNPQTTTLILRYLNCLTMTSIYPEGKSMFESLLTMHPNNSSYFLGYVKYLHKNGEYMVSRGLILGKIEECDRAKNSQPDHYGHYSKDSYISLYIQYAKACHRSKNFEDGIKKLKILEAKQQGIKKQQSIMLWRVYLEYQSGNYTQSFKYADIVSKQCKLSKQDQQYYRYQKCKFSVLLGKWLHGVNLADVILEKPLQTRNKLKALALKAYCFMKLMKIQQCLQLFQNAVEEYQDDIFILVKYCLVLLMCLPRKQGEEGDGKGRKDKGPYLSYDQLRKSKIQSHLNYIVYEIFKCSNKDFDNQHFSEHFNWYEEVEDYRYHLVWLLQKLINFNKKQQKTEQELKQPKDTTTLSFNPKGYFKNLSPNNFLIQPGMNEYLKQKIRQLAYHLFMTLVQGYNDCKKSSQIMRNIEEEVDQKIKKQKQIQGVEDKGLEEVVQVMKEQK